MASLIRRRRRPRCLVDGGRPHAERRNSRCGHVRRLGLRVDEARPGLVVPCVPLATHVVQGIFSFGHRPFDPAVCVIIPRHGHAARNRRPREWYRPPIARLPLFAHFLHVAPHVGKHRIFERDATGPKRPGPKRSTPEALRIGHCTSEGDSLLRFSRGNPIRDRWPAQLATLSPPFCLRVPEEGRVRAARCRSRPRRRWRRYPGSRRGNWRAATPGHSGSA
mmetsp:Transcript_47964/g.133737  ORF Transcript_47964/g.133737 Transcript_47964/m.133737 type:complete len:221 (+) Transcript_47964:224-886(+)